MNPDEREHFVEHTRTVIAVHGWAVQGVFGTPEDPQDPLAYTVGLTGLGHSELIVTGLGGQQAAGLLNAAGTEVRSGRRFVAGVRSAGVIGAGLTVGFRSCGNSELVMARAIYGDSIAALQLLWPDKLNRLPTESGLATAHR